MMGAHVEERLPALPALGGLMLRSVVTLGRPDASRGLPNRSVVVEAHTQDLEALAAYNRVTGFGITDAVPATWLHVNTFPLQLHLMASKDFPFALSGLVHASNQMTLHRTVAPTETLRLAVWAEQLQPHRKGAAFDLVGQVRVGGELVWEGRSTYLALKKKVPGEAPPSPPRLEAPATAAGQVWKLPADLGRRYAKVSGDSNPIHLHPLTSMLFGFKRPIIHGMWTHARALSALGPRLPDAYTVKVSFTKPIMLPNRVSYAVAATADGFSLAVTNSDGSKPYLVGAVIGR